MGLSRREAYWVLNALPAVGPVTLNRLLRAFGDDPQQILEARPADLQAVAGVARPAAEAVASWREKVDLERQQAQAERLGAAFISREDPRYPAPLARISDPPIGLFCIGDYDFSKPTVAIVGTRRCTHYGQAVARSFAAELARRGFCVASGMARGIDTLAHKGALDVEGGATVAVLGNGIDIVYPPENVDLYRAIPKYGAVVAEFPFGRRADKQTFPMRNRLVSGLSLAVIVVETDEKGGSMITARFASEQNRLVCAVPGRIDQPASRGCHQLLRDGATLLSSIDDLFDELAYEQGMPELQLGFGGSGGGEGARAAAAIGEEARKALEAFAGGEALTPDQFAERLGVAAPAASSRLMALELEGHVKRRFDGRYEAAARL